jgi:hypothetical protein
MEEGKRKILRTTQGTAMTRVKRKDLMATFITTSLGSVAASSAFLMPMLDS